MAFSVLPHFMIYVGGHIWKNVQRVDAHSDDIFFVEFRIRSTETSDKWE